MNGHNQPLVSIVVITYNSAKYVFETLESVKSQTYENIELIITDDASQDNTVQICKEWLEENKIRFLRTQLITKNKNSGIPANCNSGVKVAKGEWIKLIAGDDALNDSSISILTQFALKNTDAQIIFADADFYDTNFQKESIITKTLNLDFIKYFSGEKLNPDIQFEYILRHNPIIACTAFISNKVFTKISFNEKFITIEDHPFWLSASANGFILRFIDVVIAKYRIHPNSVQNHNQLFKYQQRAVLYYQKDFMVPFLKGREKSLHFVYRFLYNVPFWLNFTKYRKICLAYNKIILMPVNAIIEVVKKRSLHNIIINRNSHNF